MKNLLMGLLVLCSASSFAQSSNLIEFDITALWGEVTAEDATSGTRHRFFSDVTAFLTNEDDIDFADFNNISNIDCSSSSPQIQFRTFGRRENNVGSSWYFFEAHSSCNLVKRCIEEMDIGDKIKISVDGYSKEVFKAIVPNSCIGLKVEETYHQQLRNKPDIRVYEISSNQLSF